MHHGYGEVNNMWNVLNLFNYIFYRITKVYASGIDKKDPEMWACAVTSAAQGFYLASLISCTFNIIKDKNLFVGLGFTVLIINYLFFFNEKKYIKYCAKWDNEDRRKKYIRGVLVIIFLIAAIPTVLIFSTLFY